MKLIYIIILFFLSINVKAQSNDVFRFVVENKIIIDSVTGFYQGKSFEYSYNRICYGDSVFKEVGLFAQGDGSTAFFKIKNGYWYIKYGKKWSLFYSPYKTVIPKIKISGSWYILKPQGTQILNDINCEVYNVLPMSGFVSGDIKYWFSPNYGIIKIKTNEVALIREDFANKKAAH